MGSLRSLVETDTEIDVVASLLDDNALSLTVPPARTLKVWLRPSVTTVLITPPQVLAPSSHAA